MRTFSCLTWDGRSSVPVLSFVFAANEARAEELARRELAEVPGARSVEVWENGRLVSVVRIAGSAA